MKVLAEELSEPLSIIFLKSWMMGEVPEDRRGANVVSIFKKGRGEEPVLERPSRALVPTKVVLTPAVLGVSQRLLLDLCFHHCEVKTKLYRWLELYFIWECVLASHCHLRPCAPQRRGPPSGT